jgi:hypothetical protein
MNRSQSRTGSRSGSEMICRSRPWCARGSGAAFASATTFPVPGHACLAYQEQFGEQATRQPQPERARLESAFPVRSSWASSHRSSATRPVPRNLESCPGTAYP